MALRDLAARAHDLARAGRRLTMRAKLVRCASVGESPTVIGRVVVRGSGRVVLGDRVVIDGRQAAVEFVTGPGAEIRVGDDVRIGPGVSIEARDSIAVGARSTLGAFAKLLDNHLHRVEGDRGSSPRSNAVVVGEDVRVGPRAVILPGARLSCGSAVGPATVVSRHVPEGCTIAGSPPRLAAPRVRGVV